MRVGIDRAIEVNAQLRGTILRAGGETARTHERALVCSYVGHKSAELIDALNVHGRGIVLAVEHNHHFVLPYALSHEDIDLARALAILRRYLDVVFHLSVGRQLLLN